MTRKLKVAVTETINAYPDMPAELSALDALADRLEEIRTANVDHNIDLIRQAAAVGVRAIGLGELCTAPYFAITKHPVWLPLAEDAESGKSVSSLRQVARELEVVIVAPIYELERSTNRRFNTAVVIDAGGELRGKYRKTHIPDGRNEQGEFNEPFYFGRAEEPPFFPVFETRFARIGVATCYDRHFDGVVRSLAKNGAELIFSPAVTFGAKSERMWELEFEVDAARHNVFIAGSNRKGVEAPYHQPYFGRSYVVGPNGRAELDRYYHGLVIAEIDLGELSRPDPSGWNLARDRRPDIYED
jgi:N-carbamoylputrescine amidase